MEFVNAQPVNGASKIAFCHCHPGIASCSHFFRECVVCTEVSPFTFLLSSPGPCVYVFTHTHTYMLQLVYNWNHRITYACWRFEVFMVVKMYVCGLVDGYQHIRERCWCEPPRVIGGITFVIVLSFITLLVYNLSKRCL
jgi:hypothetical protein